MNASSLIAYTNCLRVHRIALAVRLGFGKEERVTPQPVEVDVSFFFPAVTEASKSDNGDFICYDKLSHAFKDLCADREFKLIEFLCMELYQVARKAAPPEVKITLRLTKCEVPVEFIHGGASFTYTDIPPFSWTPPL